MMRTHTGSLLAEKGSSVLVNKISMETKFYSKHLYEAAYSLKKFEHDRDLSELLKNASLVNSSVIWSTKIHMFRERYISFHFHQSLCLLILASKKF